MYSFDAAQELGRRGFKVFPIKAGAKAPPLWKDWPNRSSTTIPADWPAEANIGIHCDGLIVIDVDVKKGGDQSYAKLDIIEGFPHTLGTLTPSGGRHLFFRSPHPVPNGVNVLGPGLDIRSTGGYVVAPGSEVPAGRYRFQADVPIADAPDWLIAKLGTASEKPATSSATIPDADAGVVARAVAWLLTQAPAVEGQGGDAHTFGIACGLRDRGVSRIQAFALLQDGWNQRCSPPWELDDLWTKVVNAYTYAENDPGIKAIKADDFPIVDVGTSAPKPTVRTRVQRLDELAAAPTGGPGYLVKGILQRGSQAVMYGAPGEGKTFVALDMAYHVAAGLEWNNRRVRQGTTLYLAYEGTGGLARRAMALRQKHGTKQVPLYVHAADYNLREPTGRQLLSSVLAELPEKPTLIVIDTLARAMKGGDENSAQDMGALMDAVGALVANTGACVLLIHHSGKNKAGGARGSSALLGAIDTELEIDEQQIKPTKQRDVELCEPIGFQLVPMIVGVDEDGDELTSCVVEPAKIVKHTSKISGDNKRAFDVLCEMHPDNAPVSEAEWLEACAGFNLKQKRMYDVRRALLRANLIVTLPDNRIQRRME